MHRNTFLPFKIITFAVFFIINFSIFNNFDVLLHFIQYLFIILFT